jgi:hypothetical protein
MVAYGSTRRLVPLYASHLLLDRLLRGQVARIWWCPGVEGSLHTLRAARVWGMERVWRTPATRYAKESAYPHALVNLL